MGKAEDHAEFLALVDRHQGIVLKIAHSYQNNATDREDLVQEILAQLWRSFPKYQQDRAFSTWMYRVALNVAISRLRQTVTPPLPLDADLSDSIAAPPGKEPDPRVSELDRFIQGLDPLNRALLVLYLEERPYREIAEILGISETNVSTKISRLKQRIREEIPPCHPT
ncbi:MAG: RNA polymerase sigma factor [Gemmataceae bacterium]